MLKVKVENMKSSNGKAVANQFVITVEPEEGWPPSTADCTLKCFQSYNSMICIVASYPVTGTKTYLDKNTWDYSKATAKYRNQFLGETKKETQAKIDSGKYILTDLN